MNIQDKVIDYFVKQGFNCITQKEFPNLIVWSSLRREDGSPLKIQTHFKQTNKAQLIIPFMVMGVTYKKPTKKEMKQISILLGHMYSSIAVARMKGKELEFDILNLEGAEEVGTTGYIG